MYENGAEGWPFRRFFCYNNFVCQSPYTAAHEIKQIKQEGTFHAEGKRKRPGRPGK